MTEKRRGRISHIAMGTLLVAALLGCDGRGPATYPVAGKVTFGGQPLTDGQIVLRDAQELLPPVQGQIESGEYKLRTTPGEKRVEITAYKITGKRFDEMMQTTVQERKQIVPEKYNIRSELRVLIEVRDNAHDFTLTEVP